MPAWLSAGAAAPGLPAHCEPQGAFLLWLSSTLGTCVPTALALATTALGSLSFLAWLFAQLPQIYKNYKIGSTAGLSIYFLVEWLLGDTTNLVGAILTKQASWQVLIASYYTFVDIILVGQFTYYSRTRAKRKRKAQEAAEASRNQPGRGGAPAAAPRERTQPKPIGKHKTVGDDAARDPSPFGSFTFPVSLSPREKVLGKRYTRVPTEGTSSASPRTVLTLTILLAVLARAAPASAPRAIVAAGAGSDHDAEFVGRVVSWLSAVMYLGSRLPQIIKNARRRSTAGLSLSLFVAAFFGNLFYSSSLLTNPLAWGSYGPHGYFGWAGADGSDRRSWVLLALPFWLGAAGVLSLDLTIAIQFVMYGDGDLGLATKPGGAPPAGPGAGPAPDTELPRGRPVAIKRVSGWMRGWIPSPGAVSWRTSSMTSQFSRRRFGAAGDADADDERPLLAGDDRSLFAGDDRPLVASHSVRAPSPLRKGYGAADLG